MQKIDFNTNRNSQVCITCNNIDPRNKEIVNASPLFTCKLAPILPYVEPVKPIPISELATSSKPRLEYINQEQTQQEQKSYNNNISKMKINWSRVIGYEEIKHIIDAALANSNRKKTHILIVGAAGTSKTVFLKTIEASLIQNKFNVHYLDATTLSSAGVIQYLFDNDVKFALIDELDKLEKEHQKVFLNMLESGVLQETKGKKNGIRKKDMKDTIFICTGNYIEKIMYPLLTRFLALNIPEYTEKQFYEIGIKLLVEQYNKTKESATYIVDNIYKIYKNVRREKPNLRNCVQVATLTDNNINNINPILQGITNYSTRYIE